MKLNAIMLSSFLFISTLCLTVTGKAQGSTGGSPGTPASITNQDCGPINQTKLKELLTQMGYTPREVVSTPGKEKYEIKITTTDFNVPMGLEISPSTNYIWLTVNLGKAPADSLKYYKFIQQNSKIQPALFYVTDSGTLMMGLPVDNRGINNALLKRYTDFIAARVSETKNYWQ